MNVIQSAAAVYILVCASAFLFLVMRAAWTGKKWTGSFKGLPMILLILSAVICAISTVESL